MIGQLNINLLTKLMGVRIDGMLAWDDQIKHILSKVSNGLRMLYLVRKLTIKILLKQFTIHLYNPTSIILMLHEVIATNHALTNCKSYKIKQNGLLLGLITLLDHKRY